MIYCVIGEQCKDVFIYGNCERFSPEAPVPVFVPIERVTNVGMAGNVIENLFALIRKFGDVKNDAIITILSDERIIKTRYVDKKSNHIFLRVDENDSVFPIKEKLLNNTSAEVFMVSDYNKGFVTDESILKIKKVCPSAVVFIDTKRHLTQELMCAVDFVKLNESEYQKVDDRLKVLFEHKFIVTLGGGGAKYGKKIYQSKNPLQTIDVSGAGDTFFAALVFMYMKHKSISQSIPFANEMAGIVVSKRGVSTI